VLILNVLEKRWRVIHVSQIIGNTNRVKPCNRKQVGRKDEESDFFVFPPMFFKMQTKQTSTKK
ncbi:MAG: hypothetical protein II489_00440, partial [Bacteroidaceae bacterium]|nr:hypothetical protein [Bacteroidaceae bacterium]